jgi:hypothetical protein
VFAVAVLLLFAVLFKDKEDAANSAG